MSFTKTNHLTWNLLFRRQLPHVRKFASTQFLKGFELLQLPSRRIPTLSDLNSKITPATGWHVTRTTSRYMTRQEWFTALFNKTFPITGYIRSQNELDFTPEPDIFHDVFGHQPFMTLPEYTQIFDLFAIMYFKAKTHTHKRDIGRLAWFGYEFGLIKEPSGLKALGAGLLSSPSEIQSVVNPAIPKLPFTIEAVVAGHKPDGQRQGDRVYGVTENSELFVLTSLDHLKSELNRYLRSL